MFFKFIIESYRNKKNRPLSFFINWFGMTLGFVAVIVMYLYIVGELNHDKGCFSDSMDRVYRCEMGDKDMGSICPSALQPCVTEMAEVQSAARVSISETVTATEGLSTNKRIKLNYLYADSTLFDIMPFRMVTGDARTALAAWEGAVVSRSTARKLYDTEDVIGRTIMVDNKLPATITGVFEDVPENSSYRPDVIATNTMMYRMWGNITMPKSWSHWSAEVFLRVKENVDAAIFETKYAAAVKKSIPDSWGSEYNDKITIRPFMDCYLSVIDGYTPGKSIDPQKLMVLGFIALLILVIAIINYVNIYTARSTEVIRAMGIKAIMGARRGQLVSFVIFDSIVIALLSAVSGFMIARSIEPIYPLIIGSAVSFSLSVESILVLFAALPVFCGVISGIFPALALTRMRPLDAMANRSSGGRQMIFVRNALIVFQFTITIILIASTIFINKQMTYMSEMKLGYDRDNVYVVNGSMFMGPRFDSFRSVLMGNPNIKNVSLMKNNPVNVGEFMTAMWGETIDESKTVNVMWNDENALALLGVKVVEGDSISPTNVRTLKYNQMMINETFARSLRQSMPDITFPFKDFIGVFKDFQSSSLKNTVEPLAIGSIWNRGDTPMGSAYIKIAAGSDLNATLKFIEKTFADIYPEQLYESTFMDEQVNAMYKEEQLFRAQLLTFSILAIFIGCLGLFALVSYSVERRRKEIAIRKVYGSTIAGVITLLSVGFIKWLIISFVIGAPVAWYAMTRWVEQFAYRTEMSWWVFAVALLAVLLIAMFTVFGQTYIAATANPSKSLKSE